MSGADQTVPSAWRSMESAPRDGTKVDLFYPERGRWTDADWKPTGWGRDEWRNSHTVRVVPAEQPTHWMPLPAVPGENAPAHSDAERMRAALRPFAEVARHYPSGGLSADLQSRVPNLIDMLKAQHFYSARAALGEA